MPTTTFATADPATRKHWSTELWKYAIANTFFVERGMLGTGATSIIQQNTDLSKSKGDQITFHLLNPLVGDGQGDHGTLLNNAEAQGIGTFSVAVHERAHAVSAGDGISKQRTVLDLRMTGRDGLGVWLTEILENDIVNALSGLYNVSTAIENVNVHAPSTNRILRTGQTAAGVIVNSGTSYATDALLSANTATDALFGTKVLEWVKRKAQLATPKIRPIKVGGKDYYVCLISPLQAKALKAETEWRASQKDANVRGLDNPIFTGMLGVWDGVVIHEYDRIQSRTGAGGTTPAEGFTLNAGLTATTDPVVSGKTVDRALFLGAQAGALAWAQKPNWIEDYEDIGTRKPVIGTEMIYGMSKTIFNAPGTSTPTDDYGVIAVDTMVVAD